MKSCPRCGVSYADSTITWVCGYKFQPGVAATGNNPALYGYNSTYHTAQGIAKFISAVGWIVTAIGALFFIVALSQSGGAMLFLLPSLVGTLGGLLLIGTGQFTRAAVDTADHTLIRVTHQTETYTVLLVEGQWLIDRLVISEEVLPEEKLST